MITPKVFTVSQLNAHIGSMIAADPALQVIFIEGELSNVRLNNQSGHLYFSLKDSKSVVRAVMFSWSVKNLRFRPEDGMKVIMRAQVTVYEPMGQYQLKVEDMQPDGVGVLALQLEQLKKKLDKEGLFDPSHKQSIPAMPRTIGVITSPTGAALRDIMDILSRRYPCAEVVLAPVLVQGDGAPAQLINAVNTFSENRAADVIIIGRGGGSMEDLWAFNDEGLARAIYDCRIPVISAVGHETDVTICDFVADLRAPTPSAAAELAVPNGRDLIDSAYAMIREAAASVNAKIALAQSDTDKMTQLVLARSPEPMMDNYIELVDSLYERAENAENNQLRITTASAQELFSKVEALSPVAVLNRGFARLMNGDADVTSVTDVKAGDDLRITLKDGDIRAVVAD
ncbi:MAG: exodeoxyribonuclease VII large subunit [Ruminococcus sp.]|nr:exodeoxyribonuclease VII large subunit [Ruminococcus sp.]